MLAALDPKTWWYVARAAGLVSWALLTAAVLWGLFLSTRTLGKAVVPAWLLDLHRFLGALAVTFVGVHLVGLVADDYVAFGWREVLLPMASTWRPGPVAWGVVALYLLAAVEVTSLLQRRLPRRWWRRVHLLSFPLFVLATVHALTAGTDATNRAVTLGTVVAATLVVFLTTVRLLARRARPERAPTARSRPGSGDGAGVTQLRDRVAREAPVGEDGVGVLAGPGGRALDRAGGAAEARGGGGLG
jgi:DMSO/TMAO reductase YedYZ heme-binding membrane subunit